MNVTDLFSQICHGLFWCFLAVTVWMLDIPKNAAGFFICASNKLRHFDRVREQSAGFNQYSNLFISCVVTQLLITYLCCFQICLDWLWVQGQQNTNKRDFIFCGKVNLIFCLLHLKLALFTSRFFSQSNRRSDHRNLNTGLAELATGFFQMFFIKNCYLHRVDLVGDATNLDTVNPHILCSP